MTDYCESQNGFQYPSDSINENIAFAINYYMKSEKCKVRDLAQKCGLNSSAIYKWKRADACPSFTNLIAIADYFGCSLDCLIGRQPIDSDYGFVPKHSSKPFCDILNEILLEKGITEYRLVKLLNVSRTKVSSCRKGKSLPDAKGLYDLAEILNISADFLAGRE